MQSRNNGNLTINGIGSSGGGEFREVNIDGVAKVNGAIRCEQFRCNGTLTVNGDVHADSLQINGLSTLNGALTTGRARVDGRIKVEDAVTADTFKLHGLCSMASHLSAEHIELDGSVSIGGNCEAETIVANGRFTIGGLLNAGTIKMRLYHGSSARELGGEHIEVRKGERGVWQQLFSAFIPSFAPKLTVDLIEGDDIYVEHTEADVIRGNSVKLGPGCRIGRVEYRQSFDRHSDSSVQTHLKV